MKFPIRFHAGTFSSGLIQRLRSRERERERQRRSHADNYRPGSGGSGRMAQSLDRDRNQLSYDARPFYPRDSSSAAEDRAPDYEPLPPSKQALGERLFPRVLALQPVSCVFKSSPFTVLGIRYKKYYVIYVLMEFKELKFY